MNLIKNAISIEDETPLLVPIAVLCSLPYISILLRRQCHIQLYVLSVSAVDPVYGVRLDSTVPAVELALDHVNTNPTLLPGVNLT